MEQRVAGTLRPLLTGLVLVSLQWINAAPATSKNSNQMANHLDAESSEA